MAIYINNEQVSKIVSDITVSVVQSWWVSETGTACIKNTLVRKFWGS